MNRKFRSFLGNFLALGKYIIIPCISASIILWIIVSFIHEIAHPGPDFRKLSQAREDIIIISFWFRLYKSENGSFPSSEQGLQALVTRPAIPLLAIHWRQYIEVLPLDPWNHPYKYRCPGIYGSFDIYSMGPDGIDATVDDIRSKSTS